MPAVWTNQDIGTVGVSGSATHTNGTFTVTGGGLDIWGTADAFHYVSQPLAGDGSIVARVSALQNTHVNAKAGVMMRGALTASAQHVMINAAVDGSIEFISRSGAGSAAAYLAGGWQPRPTWLKLTRAGSTVTGSVSSNGQVWTVVGSTTVSGLTNTGLVVTSADVSVRNVSTFDSVTVTVPPVIPPPPPPPLPGAPASPSPVTGATGVVTATRLTWSAPGATTYDVKLGTINPPATVVAANLTAASYQPTLTAGTRYFWQVVARNTAGLTAGPVWSFTAASAPTTALPAVWTNQDIGTVGVSGSATHTNGTFTVTGGGLDIWGTADAFHYVSQPLAGDGSIVARVSTLQNTHVNAKAGVMMRGALTASAQHVMINAAVDGSIEFISRSGAGSAAAYLAGGWQPRPTWLKLTRAGSTVTGSVSSNGQVWTVVGSTTVSGLTNTGLVVTSADVSVRNVSTFDSVTVTVPPVIPPPPPPPLPGAPASPSPVTGATGVVTATRLTWSAPGATTYDVKLGTINPPATVVAANLTAASYQPTLTAGTRYFWQVVARNTAGLTAGPVWSFTAASAPTTALPAVWTNQDIGTVGVSGSATHTNGTFTVTGGGLDIWGTADAFHYVSQPLAGDGSIVARVSTLQNTHVNAKAGVMMRGALTASAQHVMINAAVDGSIEFISRSGAGSAAAYLAGGWQPRPTWLKLTRAGSTVTGSVSSNGQVWTVVGSTTVSGLTNTGLVVTSADVSVRNVSTFDSVAVN